jgi:hypothetical protein
MSFPTTTYNPNYSSSPEIDATVQANVFHNILDVCDNTLDTDVAKVKYYVMWGVSFEDVFDISGRDLTATDTSASVHDIVPISNHTIYGLASSNTSRTIQDLIDQSIGDSARATRLKGYITLDPNSVEAKLDPSMNLPAFPQQSVYIYSSIPNTDKNDNDLDNFSLFREGLYFGISVNNWVINIIDDVRRDNINEATGISIEDIKQHIKLSNGEEISGNNVLEMGFIVQSNNNYSRTNDENNSTLLQEHYEYCSALYDIHENISGGETVRDDNHNLFKTRTYHIGSETIKRKVKINQPSKGGGSSSISLGDGSTEDVHYILRIKPSIGQMNIQKYNLT